MTRPHAEDPHFPTKDEWRELVAEGPTPTRPAGAPLRYPTDEQHPTPEWPAGPSYETVISELEAKLAAAEAEASGRWLRMDLVMRLIGQCPPLDYGAIPSFAAQLEGYIETGESR